MTFARPMLMPLQPLPAPAVVQRKPDPGVVAGGRSLAPPASGIDLVDRLPQALRHGLTARFGMDFGHVRVHRDSARPAGLQALAYTQGADVFLAPGQGHLLGHELGHVVQQAQGRVRPTQQTRHLVLNDDVGLELEADHIACNIAGNMAGNLVNNPAQPPSRAPDDLALQSAAAQSAPISSPSTAAPEGVVQRYSDVGGGTRYSDDHQFMVLNKQSLWVRADSLAQANLALKAKGAYIKLEPTGLVIDSAFGGQLHEVKPAWNSGRRLGRMDRERIRLAQANIDPSSGFVAHADCFMTAQTVMGVNDSPVGVLNTTHPVVGQGGDRGVVKEVSTTEMTDRYGGTGLASTLGGGSPSRGHYAFLLHVLPKFFEWLHSAPVQTTALKGAADTFCTGFERYAGKRTKDGLEGSLRAYAELSGNPANQALKDGFSRIFAVNEYLSPEIGEGLAVLNDPSERKRSQELIANNDPNADVELWNYHFAGVVLKDGSDYVTLENYSVGDTEVDNGAWLFQLYGVGQQSFHAEMSAKPGISRHGALTLGFSSAKPTLA